MLLRVCVKFYLDKGEMTYIRCNIKANSLFISSFLDKNTIFVVSKKNNA